LFKRLDAKPRLIISVAGSLIIYVFTPGWLQLATRIIIAWNGGVICFLALVWMMMNRATPEKMRLCAQSQDESRWIILFAVVTAACTSLLAIIFMLNGSKNTLDRVLILHITLALFTIVASWLLIHTMFALHYAHLYYLNSDRLDLNQIAPLEFPTEKLPDYGDFLYFSFGIGMTSQVADVQITSRLLRRLALVHQMLTFFFNTLILALGVNILAGLI
jgi:uncharacterized membrane protein